MPPEAGQLRALTESEWPESGLMRWCFMIIAQEIDRLLMKHAPAGLCGGCIATVLGAEPRSVELRIKALATTPYVRRVLGVCDRCGTHGMICVATGQAPPDEVIGKALKAMRIKTENGENGDRGG